ncbi:hypothetical protein GCM10025859_32870 [Alicyclobacillus fastidiosus]|nr:hypothetical protein GCM10025859_32870 [Alicyclobacillus fastidiosus]
MNDTMQKLKPALDIYRVIVKMQHVTYTTAYEGPLSLQYGYQLVIGYQASTPPCVGYRCVDS